MAHSNASTQFSATDPALGYLYQIRSALFWALQRLKSTSDFLVSIEILDDVTFETAGGKPTELLQTKHHLTAKANLTDASTDLWKTLRIWCEGTASEAIPETANLILVTTGAAQDNSIASKLRATDRDVDGAVQSLTSVANSSTNESNKNAYKAFLALSDSERKAILRRVTIVDAASTIDDLGKSLRAEVFWASGKDHHDAFLQRLEGWWYRRVLTQLADRDGGRIGSVEIEAMMSDLREEFKRDSLPIDDDLLDFTLDDTTAAAHSGSVFVKQLDLVKAGKRRIAIAIRDYFRAYEQRSRWLREDLIVELELHKYEKRLIEEWEVIFEAMRDELGDDAAQTERESAARSVLTWAERTTIPVRPTVTEPFVTRGSLQMLADEVRIGWHPEFQNRLEAILNAEEE